MPSLAQLFNDITRALGPYEPWVKQILAVLVAALLLNYLYRRLRHRFTFWKGQTTGLSRKERRRLLRLARQCLRAGQIDQAGHYFEAAGSLKEALEAFRQGKEHHQAGGVAERMEAWAEAARLYALAGDFDAQAALHRRRNEWIPAAEAYLKAGRKGLAAEAYDQGGRHGESGDLYRELRYFAKASEAYERGGNLRAAAEMAAQAYLEEKTHAGQGSFHPQREERIRRILDRAGRLYEQIGDFQEAARIYLLGEAYQKAGEAYERVPDPQRAAEAYLQAGDHERAARMLSEAGDRRQARTVRAEHLLRSGRLTDAAAAYEEAGDPIKAAEIFEQAGRPLLAAQAYAAAKEYLLAATLFQKGGNEEKAAEALLKGGAPLEAARIYERRGALTQAAAAYAEGRAYLHAGRLYLAAKMQEQAIETLQQIEPSADEFREASTLLAEIFIATGRLGLARERIQQALRGEPVHSGTLALYYQLALLQEREGKLLQAIQTLERIQATRLHYRDVETRLQQLRTRRPLG